MHLHFTISIDSCVLSCAEFIHIHINQLIRLELKTTTVAGIIFPCTVYKDASFTCMQPMVDVYCNFSHYFYTSRRGKVEETCSCYCLPGF